MKRNRVKHHIDGLAALLLFAVFAVCILMVLLTGADAYRRLTSRDNAAHTQRTCVQYLAQKVRQSDREGSILIQDFEGVQTLVLGADEENITRIYCYDGYLMELYSDPESGLFPESGEIIMEAESLVLDLEKTNGVLSMEVTVGGRTDSVAVTLRSGKGWRS